MLTFEKKMPEETGIPSDAVIRFINRLKEKNIPMHSILLLHKDALIAEGYYAPYQAEDLHRMFSITKSFTAIAIGLLAEEGKLSLDDPIIKYFPDKTPKGVHPYIAAMTIKDMLMMRTCHAATTYKLDMTKDWVESFFHTPPTHPSGRLFHYDTSSAHTLCALAERLSGMPMLSYLKKKLSVLGLSGSSYIIKDPFGVSMGGSGLVACSLDLLKFAYLLAHKGTVNGKRLLSSEYIETATSHLTDTLITAPVSSEAQGYGYQIWRNEKNGFTCYGMGGQLIIFLPDYDLICITTADTQGIGGGNQVLYDAFFEEVLPFVSESPLPVSEEAKEIYKRVFSELKIAPLPERKWIFPTTAYENKTYYAVQNPAGFESFSLMRKNSGTHADTGILSFILNKKTYSVSFGYGYMETGLFPVYDLKYAASGAWLSDDTLYIKAHIIDSYVGSVHFQLVFRQNDLTVFMKKQEESLFQEFNGHLYCTI